jgi:hypothetical protein
MSPRTYDKAKRVVEAAEADPESFGDLPAAMDAEGKVDPAYRELRLRQGDTDGDDTGSPSAAADGSAAADAEPVSAEMLNDHLGQAVPDNVAPVFQAGRRLRSVGDRVAKLQGQLDDLAGEPGVEIFGVGLGDQAAELVAAIREAAKLVVCPRCAALGAVGGCDGPESLCSGRGWLTWHEYQTRATADDRRHAERFRRTKAA